MRVKDLKPFSGPIVVAYLAVVIFVASFFYANYTARQTGKKFCESIGIIVEAYKTAPEPPTAVGKKFKISYNNLYKDLGCDDG